MCKPIIKKILIIIIVCLSLFFVSGCISVSPTQPNLPYTNYNGYNTFQKTYSLIADEIGKLPEIQDGISVDEKKAIDFLIKTFSTDPKKFQKVFLEMYNTGYPEVRKYCTPLQAAFWLIEDGKIQIFVDLMNNYDLQSLLDSGWNMDFLSLTESEVVQVVNGLPEDLSKIYKRFDFTKKLSFTNQLIMTHYNNNRIPIDFSKLIKNAIASNKNKKRWGEFENAVERLNAPMLISYFEKRFLIPTGTRKNTAQDAGSNKQFYFKKKGKPNNFSNFTVYCLRRAGYSAFSIKVYPNHTVCTFEDLNGEKYILDQSNQSCAYGQGIMDKKLYLRNRNQIN